MSRTLPSVLVLALDTSSAACVAAVVEHAEGHAGSRECVLAQRSVVAGRRHGELLAPLLSSVLADAGQQVRDVDAVAVGVGPGPFTGLRVGVVTATALGQALRVPVHGVCSLDAIGAALPGRVAVAGDARRREVYWAVYEDGKRVAGPAVDRPQVLLELGVDRVVGAGATLYAEVLLGLADPTGPQYPSPVLVAHLALGTADAAGAAGLPGIAGPTRLSSAPPIPLYLRRPDAVLPGPAKRVTA
ncbi:MAG: tRNA (adenosine(37)-N6)-threonylcarbamoyltransferase complex dimerization subunit type 1 TsaB [Frankiaceae bacterium]